MKKSMLESVDDIFRKRGKIYPNKVISLINLRKPQNQSSRITKLTTIMISLNYFNLTSLLKTLGVLR